MVILIHGYTEDVTEAQRGNNLPKDTQLASRKWQSWDSSPGKMVLLSSHENHEFHSAIHTLISYCCVNWYNFIVKQYGKYIQSNKNIHTL